MYHQLPWAPKWLLGGAVFPNKFASFLNGQTKLNTSNEDKLTVLKRVQI